ncbi:hypothetical protein CHU98_g1442 [Xylaria longipes]|nr:hypothetical protein CHU98_g1442 [Xylaria longipes]
MEVAGLVLGALPIAILAVEKYLKPIESYKNYSQTLKEIRRNLFVQEQQLQVTLEGIGLLKPTLPEVQQKLREVNPECSAQFIDILEHMDNMTSRLMDKLEIDSDGKPKWTDETPERVSWEWRRVKRSFGDKYRKELFDELQHWNTALKNCLEPKREIPSDHADLMTAEPVRLFDLKSCDEARENVRIVHEALVAAWSNCTCHQHPSNVELIWQHAGLKETGQLGLSVPELGGNGRDKHWQKVSISIDPNRMNSASDCNAAPSLSSTTKLAPDSTSVVPRKRKPRPTDGLRGILSLKLRPRKKPVTSLQLETLGRSQNGPLDSSKGKQVANVRLSRKERLGIAAAAVWAVLILCGTPWLEERWLGKEDITLLVDIPAQGNGFDRPKIYPSLSHIFTSQQETSNKLPRNQYSDNHQQFQTRHKTLFTLGILLIELGLNKAFHQIRADTNTGGPIHETSVQDDYITAKQVIDSEELELELGESYANAVQRCIQCHFLGPESTQSFLHSRFRKQFFTGVVAPVQATFDAQITSVNSL